MAATMPHLRTYRVELHQDPGSTGWWVEVPALPGCFTQGDTVALAMERVQEAISAYLASLAKHGEPIPPPDADWPAVSVPEPRA